ncbi:serine hydrolase domain-containing protein [Actinosynnema sp. NPDC023658]|uniref:serine hydrolase domain-containing protein n=1 Tax=Actinosynnema sp. NPDC023658 TaxID=3155465 RepID=UPI0033C956BE
MRIPALLIATTLLTAVTLPAQATGHEARFDQPREGWSDSVLRTGTPERVGLDPAPIDAALAQIERYTVPDATGHPLYAGAVTLFAHDGVVVTHEPTGWAVRYSDAAGTELPEAQRVPMTQDTIFDLASISKLFTSVVVMRQYELGRFGLDDPVARHLPEFGVNGKESITVRQLLTHTSGLVAWLPLWSQYPDVPSRIKAVMDTKPSSPPGTTYLYSDLNLITLGLLAEKWSGKKLDELVRDDITRPLGLQDTGYNPPAAKLDRIAATEYQAGRGIIRGTVHDENSWSLGGVAGHAGVFSTARELAVLGQTILNGGRYADGRILRPETVELMLTDFNQQFPGNSHGLGFELDQRWYMGALTSPRAAGHTGYTGTTLVLDPLSRSIAILLTNRVHPSRNWGSINPARRAAANGLAQALAVKPRHGTAWTPETDGGTLTTRDLPQRSAQQRLSFWAFVDLDPADKVVVEATNDGSTWREVHVLAGYGLRRWQKVEVSTASATQFRWRYVRGSGYGGRGVYVDSVMVTDERGVALNAEHDQEGMHPEGWRSANR